MRRMHSNLVAMAIVLLGMAMSTITVKGQSQILIDLTNQVWRYDQSGTDPGAFWDPLFDDSLWLEGRSILAAEDSVDANLSANVYPYTNTVLLPPGGRLVDYFRTHFTFNGANPDTWVLTASNLVDDGYVMYLNGVEASRYNMNANDLQAAQANPGGEGIYVVRELCFPAGTLVQGDNVLAVRVHSNAGTSSDVVWGTVLHASPGSAPAITSPTATVNIALGQGLSSNLTATVQSSPCAALQWYFTPEGGGAATAIPGATAATYTINNMDASQAGTYFLRAVNAINTAQSPNFVVTYDVDVTGPVVRLASADPVDLTIIRIVLSEDVIDAFSAPGTIDPIYFYLEDISNPGNLVSANTVNYGTSSNILIMSLFTPRDPAVTYNLNIALHGGAMQDRFGNPMADPSITRVTIPSLFQEGVNGYAGTLDTEIHMGNPDTVLGGAGSISVDLADPAPNNTQGLLRFDNIIGGGPGQIPLGAIVTSAKLRIYTQDPTTAAGLIRMLRMLVPWDENSTWNSMVTGINETNDVEAVATPDAVFSGNQDESFDEIDVTATVQLWANGQPNYGWVFLASATDGWDWTSSEGGTVANRPSLLVEFAVEESPCEIEDEPDSLTVDEGLPFTLTVLSRGSDLRYQWYKNDEPIPGATASSYNVTTSVPSDSGTYHVVVQNNIPSLCTSADAVVTVTPDLTAPALTSAVGNPDQTTVTLVFNDDLNPTFATDPANYAISGLSISGVALAANGSTVTLTTTVARVVGQNYTLTVQNLRDDAVAQNVLSPNPTVVPLAQQIVLASFNSIVWKYETNGLDLGNNGVPWAQPGYDDSAWPSGNAVLGFETGQGTLDSLFAQGLNTNNAQLWPLMRPGETANIITYYVRTSVNIPYDVSGATITLRQVIDDGSVYYFNGVERFRFDMPAGDDTYLTEAVSATGEAVIRSQNLTNISCGPNVVAVSIHNDSPTSSDVLFAAELLGTFPTFGVCTGASQLFIVNNGDGTVTLSWTGTGTLLESTDLTNWTPSANQNNPQTFAPVGLKFYKVQ